MNERNVGECTRGMFAKERNGNGGKGGGCRERGMNVGTVREYQGEGGNVGESTNLGLRKCEF